VDTPSPSAVTTNWFAAVEYELKRLGYEVELEGFELNESAYMFIQTNVAV
jgi:hypothetical protein